MKLIPTAHELISNMGAFFHTNNGKRSYLNEEPLRAELFSSDQMERFGAALASLHKLSTKPPRDHLLKRLSSNEALLEEARKIITYSIKKKLLITPAGEWLIDNFYLIEEHIRIAKTHFPKNYSEDLPQVADANAKGVTRVYDIVLQMIAHSDGRVDVENLSRYIHAYQTVTPLQLGELWAIPIMLRLALIENIRRLAAKIGIDRVDRNLADYWVRQIFETLERSPKDLLLVIADMARSNPPMVSAFVSELTRRLRGQGPNVALALSWVEQQLSDIGSTSNELVNAEIQKQAADQVSISNSISSLRMLGSMDWREFVEDHSIVEQTLRSDQAGVYALMDFNTRDRYRHVVEKMARLGKHSEWDVARLAVRLSATGGGEDQRAHHVGYYLIGDGLHQMRQLAGVPPTLTHGFRQFCQRFALPLYIGAIGCLTAASSAWIFVNGYGDLSRTWVTFLAGFMLVLCTSQLGVSVVNFLATLFVKPHLLPRLDFSKHIPVTCRTMVIIPAMLTGAQDVEDLVEALEVRYLSNRSDHLHFGLLTDFTDADQEHMPEDGALVEQVQASIIALNSKYHRVGQDLFYFFHRPRRWNPKENAWMGFERKRGKLSELNGLLRGGSRDRFSHIIGDPSVFPEVKYVITLDSDTQLPMGSAWKLIGTMAHPLNLPWYDERLKRVTRGYGILQPRVAVSLPDTRSSRFTRMNGNEPGVDPYTRASSDVYQDIFAEGSFIGKGIYEVDTFIRALDGRFPDDAILSHDLLEGCYLRSGLVSDVQLFEKYPATYMADTKRNARWIRGDWQILPWFLPWVPGAGRRWQPNPISGLSHWKILDNIRRSLVPIALTCLLVFGWVIYPSSFFWTYTVSGIIVVPIFITTLWDAVRKPGDVIFSHHLKNFIVNLGSVCIKTLFTLICLPFTAYVNITAIVRTIWRMSVTRKWLLEWNPSGIVETQARNTLAASYAFMWIQPLLVLTVPVYVAFDAPLTLTICGPILALWLIAPAVTWWASRPIAQQEAILTADQHLFLQKLARKTWYYFERFVVEGDRWLPPDNFQEQPEEMLAHRTSPTNIGLALLAGVSACDFGYLTSGQFIERTAKTITSMGAMERFKGHFYNWYDTQTLAPLLPKYISTVDSGNLGGHLLVLRQFLLSIPDRSLSGRLLLEGLRDTLHVLIDTVPAEAKVLLDPCRSGLIETLDRPQLTRLDVKQSVETLDKAFALVFDRLGSDAGAESYLWKYLLKDGIAAALKDFILFTPWFLLESVPDTLTDLLAPDQSHASPTAPPIVPDTLNDIVSDARALKTKSETRLAANPAPEDLAWLTRFRAAVIHTLMLAERQLFHSAQLAVECDGLAEMEWDFLFNTSNKLLSIGYNVQEHLIDASYYDLLASEARLGIFLAIAQGQLPEESWFALGRLLTREEGDPVLLSWSGSMFEYLMPLLVMPTYEHTLLDQTYHSVVAWQIAFAKGRGLPWGISESAYNMVNVNANYQYRAFGAPGLGLKRGLEEDSVIAPYASAMALMVTPDKACKNLQLLYDKGFEGRYGFYEAIDYTPSRLQPGQTRAIVYAFMVHHQGMSLLSLSYLLRDKPMQRLFEAEPRFKAALLLLQERIPRATTFYAHTTDIIDISYAGAEKETRVIRSPNTPLPEVQLLSNGRYHVMVTNAGAGYSRWKDLAVTRWREDGTRDNWGSFCYIRDLKNDVCWSNTFQPTRQKGDTYEATFSQGRADFHSTKYNIEVHTEMVVSSEDDIEMRRVRVTNASSVPRFLEVTTYAEVVLAPFGSDLMQQAFSNLFVETTIIPDQHAILCTRRPRSADEVSPWMFHLVTMEGVVPGSISYETDRNQFLGRGHSAADPDAMHNSGDLSGSQGSVLDPIVAIRYTVTLDPEASITLDMITGIGDSRDVCEHLIAKYQDKHHADRVFEMALTHSQVVLRQINATESDAQLFGRLASSVLFLNPAFRADASILINNQRQQSGLWSYSISGDLPIVLLRVEKQSQMQLARQLVQAHAYWRLKGLNVDLVIWNEEQYSYRQALQSDIQSLIPEELKDSPGGIFVRSSEQMSNEDRILFQTVARINLADSGGSLADHLARKSVVKTEARYVWPQPLKRVPGLPAVTGQAPRSGAAASAQASRLLTDAQASDLSFFNGTGGFSADGHEYVIYVDRKQTTPVPWVNVLANNQLGTVVSESGSAYTWTENAHELRLTPWNNDPVSDPGGEAFYLRDEETGRFWSTTLLPAGGVSPYITRHGMGYSSFEHAEEGISSLMTVHVDRLAPIKFIVIKVSNRSGRPRKLSATGYMEWVLGDNRVKTAMYIHTELDPESGALFAKNPYSTEFSNRVAFFDVDSLKKSYTGDRTEFIGRNGSLENPEALYRLKLSGRIGLALDPCAAIQVCFDLADGEEREIIYRMGAGRDMADASSLVRQYRGQMMAKDSIERVTAFWRYAVAAIEVDTPDAALNRLTNGWLTYQTLSSRLWGRSGYYQSGGAYGFRDQLQDVLSLLHTTPELARAQILLCASRQFAEGDVQHWWHPPSGRGVRTLCSDDYLWLPLVTTRYVLHTADTGVLDERVPYLEGRVLNPGEESYFELPTVSSSTATLYEHCVAAIRHGFRYGEHGLPFIGSGDWNDGLDKVGIQGRGESVWLGFFLFDVVTRFSEIAILHNDPSFAEECKQTAEVLRAHIAAHAWDGQWYLRAWFDDGTPLGSSRSGDCQIDSIAQSWSVLSGAGEPDKVRTALGSAYQRLVKKDIGIIQLLDPPFDHDGPNPGYIRGYVPGIRENGGQYTHAAVWMIMAFAKLGDTQKVWELLQMINPIGHAQTAEAVAVYKVEPYVMAADVYALPPHSGRGGWTWYTGSAGWMYTLIIESFLGLQRKGDTLTIAPCIPAEWPSFSVRYRYRNTFYHIQVVQKGEDAPAGNTITLVDDGVEHQVLVAGATGPRMTYIP